ncbi:MAG TPA: hypothetical protein VLE99_03255, partial [Candidatus Saccharimonadales bacterium]|nr:hypothetical protein [Candidatus Saccharimonadales bacterium]
RRSQTLTDLNSLYICRPHKLLDLYGIKWSLGTPSNRVAKTTDAAVSTNMGIIQRRANKRA